MTDYILGMIEYYRNMGIPYGQIAVVLPADYSEPFVVPQPVLEGQVVEPVVHDEYLKYKRGRVKIVRNRAISVPLVIDTVTNVEFDNTGAVRRFTKRT